VTAKGAIQHEYMLNFVEDSASEAFQDMFVKDWLDLKSKLNDSGKAEDEEMDERERGEKRKAMLAAASQAPVADDLYDDMVGELLDNDAKRPKFS
jgi:hypothetical protein